MPVALKSITGFNSDVIEDVINEVTVLSKIGNHPNVCQFVTTTGIL